MNFKITTEKDTMGQYTVYHSFINFVEGGKVLWKVEAIRNMLHKKDAIEIAKKEIEHIKATNKINI
jgi:hypothetical protein